MDPPPPLGLRSMIIGMPTWVSRRYRLFLFVLNLQDPSGKLYSEYIDHPTNDIYELLDSINARRNKGKDKRRLDEDGLAMHWVSNWKNTKSKNTVACLMLRRLNKEMKRHSPKSLKGKGENERD
ncbi:hypothetical protein Cantr_03548 [Candida viswanathii]|uniref:Uncharacterized protein n=1 Tax=Candida viswanathii TaxID=5486 RepID=A0A367YL11_9ASCO|nr:hypothetical protein Cantr_03548 [Candida viswanathii]